MERSNTGRSDSLKRGLAVWAENERSALGEPPTAEQLIALRDGLLSEEEAERLHDWLAVDPEWADVYLDLQRGTELPRRPRGLAAEGAPDDSVDRAWESLVARMEQEGPATAEALPEEGRVVRIRRRRSLTPFVSLAAVLVLALGLGWFLGRDEVPVVAPESYYDIQVPGEVLRDPRIFIPSDTFGLAFHIDATGLEGSVEARLHDAEGKVIVQERHQVDGAGEWVVRVPLSKLSPNRTHVLSVYSSGASAEDPPLRSKSFTPVLEE